MVVKATIDLEELCGVENVSICARLEGDRLVEVPDGVLLSLELICVTDVIAELKDEESPRALEDVKIWTELISVVNATTDSICEEVGCELILLDSAGLLGTITDENVEKSCNVMLVKDKKIDWVLNSAELCGVVAGEDTDSLGDKMVVDGNTFCDVESGRALAEERVVDWVMAKTGVVTTEIVDVSTVEEARESIAKLAETVERYVVEVARDCNVEVVEGVTITEDAAMTVKSTVVAMVAINDDDVATVLVETVAIEDCIVIVLAGRLSPLMMSAAFAGVLDSMSTT